MLINKINIIVMSMFFDIEFCEIGGIKSVSQLHLPSLFLNFYFLSNYNSFIKRYFYFFLKKATRYLENISLFWIIISIFISKLNQQFKFLSSKILPMFY